MFFYFYFSVAILLLILIMATFSSNFLAIFTILVVKSLSEKCNIKVISRVQLHWLLLSLIMGHLFVFLYKPSNCLNCFTHYLQGSNGDTNTEHRLMGAGVLQRKRGDKRREQHENIVPTMQNRRSWEFLWLQELKPGCNNLGMWEGWEVGGRFRGRSMCTYDWPPLEYSRNQCNSVKWLSFS